MTARGLRAPEIDEVLAGVSAEGLPPDAGEVALVAWAGYRPFLVADKEGLAVTADDLVLGRFEDAIDYESAEGKSAKIFGATVVLGAVVVDPRKLWPRGEIPYEFDSDLTTPVDGAVTKWNQRIDNPVRLRPKGPGDRNYVFFAQGPFNKSAVGMVGSGRQPITFQKTTAHRKIIHEIGHAAGLFHEHNRHDRDTYITLDKNNIPQKQHGKYRPYPANASLNLDYDLDSVMHYPPNIYKLGPIFKLTSKGIDLYEKLHGGGKRPSFQSATLSDGDVGALQAIYGPP